MMIGSILCQGGGRDHRIYQTIHLRALFLHFLLEYLRGFHSIASHCRSISTGPNVSAIHRCSIWAITIGQDWPDRYSHRRRLSLHEI